MIPLDNFKTLDLLVGDPQIQSIASVPFSSENIKFLAAFSEQIRGDRRSREFPDLMTFAFFIRKANLALLSKKLDDKKMRLGVGLVFHVTPGNVPLNFAFSLVFSLLAGNSNIVKLPSRYFPQVDLFCEVMRDVLATGEFETVAKSNVLLKYPASDVVTESFTKLADAKVLWGSNATISQIRKLDTKPRCRELVFPDRFSLAVIASEHVLKASREELQTLAKQFYNDTYLMDQNACSSPSIVAWKGANIEKAQSLFWQAVIEFTEQHYEILSARIVDKLTQVCVDSTELPIGETKIGNRFAYRVGLTAIPADLHILKGSSGLFYEYNMGSYLELRPLLNNQCQTVTYWGDILDELSAFIVSEGVAGVDRIVPIGQALNIEPEWDGYDFINQLSRIIVTH